MKRLIFFSLAVLLMTGCKQQDDESMFPDRPDVREYVVSTDEAENAAFYFSQEVFHSSRANRWADRSVAQTNVSRRTIAADCCMITMIL